MRILMVLESPFPPDIRVQKEAVGLIAAGHEVILICKPGKNAPSAETRDGIEIVRIPWLTGALGRAYNRTFRVLTFTDPFWKKSIA